MSSDLTSIYSQRNLNDSKLTNTLIYEFEGFRLNVALRMLYKDNLPIQLAPKVIETLIALVQSRGDIISKDDLMREVWPDLSVEESNLTQNIYLLRKTLGRGSDGRELIETFRRRGYLFTGRVAENAHEKEQQPFDKKYEPEIAADGSHAEEPPARSDKNLKKYLAAAAGVVLVLLLAVFAVPLVFNWKMSAVKTESLAAANLKNTRLIPDTNIVAASFTPDGKHLVYTMQENGKNSIWMKDLENDGTTQIRPSIKGNYYNPTVSNNFLYYTTERENSPNGTIVRVPVDGGTDEIVAHDVISPFTLSPDGKQAAFINGKYQLMISLVEANDEAKFLSARNGKEKWYETWSSRLSWSSDGASVIVCGGRKTDSGKLIRELIEVSTLDGTEKIIPTPENWNYVDDVVWLADKSAVIATVREKSADPFQIWHISYPNGEARRLTNDSNDYSDLNISPDSRRLIAIKHFGNLNLWTSPLKEPSKIRQITFGSAALDGLWGAASTPDGKIIYTSPRSGNVDLWQADSNSEQKQLTKNEGDWNGRPQMTVDGRYIVFASNRSGTRQIWRIDADGSNPKQLTEETLADEASVTPDGKAIYYTVKGAKGSYIAKVLMDGGKPTRISQAPYNFYMPAVSPNGKYIFCSLEDRSSTSPWKSGLLNAETGELVKVFDFAFRTARWNSDSKSVIYSLETENLWQISIENGANPQQITNFESGKIKTFAISPDFKQIIFSRGNSTNEAVLLENF